ncbi:hypothetical protein [Spirosoma pollinicola]|uniref:Uncharacterized protein n=1 Tax=Spirosoma pollinicola TaxID=2057025 RepID=A0A2K8Z9F7_9BACT|nr:hypothetical protein [Spirosoma pollinicola]AUD06484.1 hypothetical protein CWM47_34355 [Spirosoma pollinicola]
MNDDAKSMIAAYQRVFQRVPWQAFPFDDNMMYADDDGIIRDVLLRLRQLDSSTPLPGVIESADTDLHYVIVGYEKELVLYWFTHFIQEGDRGYMLYRISHFIDPSFNFMDYGYRFDLPEASMAQVYMEVFSRLNDWARLLELPYRYEVELRDEYMGYQRNNDLSSILTTEDVPVVSNVSFWRKLWTRWRL